jgi:hypothetical protein
MGRTLAGSDLVSSARAVLCFFKYCSDRILIIPLPGLPSTVSTTPRHNPHMLQIDRLKKILTDLKTSNEETI